MSMDLTGGQEHLQRRALRRHRMFATGLLLLAVAVLFATKTVPDPGFWVLLIRAGAEAALVGGLADWFAVTALFRHPLGIPIPHTALVPRNKDRIGRGLGSFVERNFLHPTLVAQKLQSIDIAARLSGWLARPENAQIIADRVVATVPFVLTSVQDRQIRDFLRRALHDQLGSVDLAHVFATVLRVLTESGQHHLVFDQALKTGRRLLAEHEDEIYRMVAERSKWWIPQTIDRAVAKSIISGMLQLLGELEDPNHQGRRRFDRAVAELIDRLEHSPDSKRRVEAIKEQILPSPAVQAYLESVWDRLREVILEDARAPDSRLRQVVAEAVRSLALAMASDRPMQDRLNRRIEDFVTSVVLPWRAEIGGFIAEVVRRWDAGTVSERIELEVGRDLQFIRINGTLVGALVGCLLFLISLAVP